MTGDLDKRTVILEQAFALFTHYGYARVTMDDIAREAGMSRPALYQHFRNKADIYGALAQAMLDRSLDTMQAALNGGGTPRERLERGVTDGFVAMMAAIEATAHGAELIDMKGELAGSQIEDYILRKRRMLAAVYAEATGNGGPDPEVMATHLSDWLEGMKLHVREAAAQVAALKAFLDIQFAAIAHLRGEARG